MPDRVSKKVPKKGFVTGKALEGVDFLTDELYCIFMGESLVLKTSSVEIFENEVWKCLVPKSFIGLRGAMGAGKTTLIGGLFSDYPGMVSSPTFSLLNTYLVDGVEIVHVDLYRLNSQSEIDSSGFWDLFGNEKSVILTEWVDRIKLIDIPLSWVKWMITIDVQTDSTRVYSLYKID